MKKTSKFERLFSFFWIRETKHPYSEKWDMLLRKLIKRGKVTYIDKYMITFDDKYSVWISNHPYASGELYMVDKKSEERLIICSKKTTILLEDFVNSLPHPHKWDDAIQEGLDKYS